MINKLSFFAFFGFVCAFAQTTAQPDTTSVWGYGLPQHRIAAQNTAPWKCRLVTVAPYKGKNRVVGLTDLAPGEIMFAGGKKTKSGLINPFAKPSLIGYDRSSDLNIPVIAIYFSEAMEGKSGQWYVGAAAGIFTIPGYGYTSLSHLSFGRQNIRFADDATPTAPPTENHFAEKGVQVPYFVQEGTETQVFVWNSKTPARITTNGSASEEMHLGEIKAFVGRAALIVTISAIDADGKVQTWSQGFQNNDWYGTHAQVFILGMSDLR
jgi:hypothetical protein